MWQIVQGRENLSVLGKSLKDCSQILFNIFIYDPQKGFTSNILWKAEHLTWKQTPVRAGDTKTYV